MAEIKMGDTIRCLKCNEKIRITEKTFFLFPDAEVIKCPHCKGVYDANDYLFKLAESEEPKPIITDQEICKMCGRWMVCFQYTIGGKVRHASMWLE